MERKTVVENIEYLNTYLSCETTNKQRMVIRIGKTAWEIKSDLSSVVLTKDAYLIAANRPGTGPVFSKGVDMMLQEIDAATKTFKESLKQGIIDLIAEANKYLRENFKLPDLEIKGDDRNV